METDVKLKVVVVGQPSQPCRGLNYEKHGLRQLAKRRSRDLGDGPAVTELALRKASTVLRGLVESMFEAGRGVGFPLSCHLNIQW